MNQLLRGPVAYCTATRCVMPVGEREKNGFKFGFGDGDGDECVFVDLDEEFFRVWWVY